MNNGFEEMAGKLNKLSKINKDVSTKALEDAANFYLKKLIPNIPVNLLKKGKHMRDQVEVKIKDNGDVQVVFKDTAFYWRFVENGTVNQRAQHFAKNTYNANKTQIERIMTQKILNEMERF